MVLAYQSYVHSNMLVLVQKHQKDIDSYRNNLLLFILTIKLFVFKGECEPKMYLQSIFFDLIVKSKIAHTHTHTHTHNKKYIFHEKKTSI